MAAPTPLGIHQIASGEQYALVADLNRVGVTTDAAIGFVKARAEYLTDKAVADAGALSRRALNELPGRVVAEVDRVIGDTREDAAEALATANKAYEYNQALVAPAEAVVNAVVTDPATPAGAAVASKEPSATAMRLGDRDVDAVRQYGADYTGATSSAAALQAAADAAGANGGRRRLILRNGDYKGSQTAPLRIPQGVTVEGEGWGTRFRTHKGIVAVASDVTFRNMAWVLGDSGMEGVLADAAAGAAFRNWRFENCLFIRARTDAGPVTGLAEHVEFVNCEWTGFKGNGAMLASGAKHVTVDRGKFHDIGSGTYEGDMCKFSGGSTGRVLDSDFRNGTRDAVDLFDGGAVTVRGCTMTDMGVCAVEAKYSQDDRGPSRHRIIENHAVRCNQSSATSVTSPAFQLAVDNAYVAGNIAESGGGAGFRVGGAQDNVVNTITSGGRWFGNHALNNIGYGLLVYQAENHVLQGNHAEGNGQAGLFIPASLNHGVYGSGNTSKANGAADRLDGLLGAGPA